MGSSHSGLIGEVTGGRRHYHHQQDAAREAAAAQNEAARVAAAAAQAAVAQRITILLQQLNGEVTKAKESIEGWHTAALKQTADAKEIKEKDLFVVEQHLRDEQEKALQEINARHEDGIAKLNAEKMAIIDQLQANYAASTQVWQQTVAQKSGQKIAIKELHASTDSAIQATYDSLQHAYTQLTTPETSPGQKITLYSQLVTWLADLKANEQLTREQSECYQKFLEAVCFTTLDLTIGDASVLNANIQALLVSTHQQQNAVLQKYYKVDSTHVENGYHAKRAAIDNFTQHVQQQEEQLSQLYDQELEKLLLIKIEQEGKLTANLEQALQALQQEREILTKECEQSCQGIEEHYTEQVKQIDQQQKQQQEQISANQAQQLGLIAENLTQSLAAIDANLQQTLATIKRKANILSFNIILAPLCLTGAFFAPALFVSASASVVATLQMSLLATGLGSLAGVINGKSKVGINVSLPTGEFYPQDNFVTSSSSTQRQEQFSLEKFKANYTARVNKIITMQAETESKLRYQLFKPVSFTFGKNVAGFREQLATPATTYKVTAIRKKPGFSPSYDTALVATRSTGPRMRGRLWQTQSGYTSFALQYKMPGSKNVTTLYTKLPTVTENSGFWNLAFRTIRGENSPATQAFKQAVGKGLIEAAKPQSTNATTSTLLISSSSQPASSEYSTMQWLGLARRAFTGEKSADVIAWQQHNCSSNPNVAALTEHVAQNKAVKIVNVAAGGVKEGVVVTGIFIGKEAARFKLGQSTVTEQVFKSTGIYLGEETARLHLGQQTTTGSFVRFLGEEAARLRLDEPTYMGPVAKQKIKTFLDTPAETIVHDAFSGATQSMLVWELGVGARTVINATPAVAKFATSTVKKATTATQEFVVTHEFQSPITFQFEASNTVRLNGGIPVDGIKVRNSVKGPKVASTNNASVHIPSQAPIDFAQWEIHPRVKAQLTNESFVKSFGEISERQLIELAHNPEAQFFLDSSSNNINVVQTVNGRLMRITIPKDDFKIISFGILKDRNYQRYISPNGRYINVNVNPKLTPK